MKYFGVTILLVLPILLSTPMWADAASSGDLLLTINDPTLDWENFGSAVATTPDGNLLVSNIYDNTNATNAGSVYLFNGTNGNLLLTINNPDPDDNDNFGNSVATTPDGDLLIGAERDDAGGFEEAGSAYLFDGVTGELLLTINNPTPQPNDQFGNSVATTPDGNLLVGAWLDDAGGFVDAGSVYLFNGTNGNLLLTINNPTPESFEYFGGAVATTPDGDLLIGAPSDNTGAQDTGSVYLFDGTDRGTTDTPLLTINNPTADQLDRFGTSVATTPDGDLLIGAFLDDAGGFVDAGSVYLFNGTNGSLLLTINHPDPEAFDRFGLSVATTLDGNLLIGSYYDDTGATNAGSVYLFNGTNGNLLLTINNPTPESFEYFGGAVATTPNGDLLISNLYFEPPPDAGSTYLFDGTNGALLFTIKNLTPQDVDQFGFSVATTPNGDLLIGAPSDNTDTFTEAGSAYLFNGTNGNLLLTINNPDPDDKDAFGYSVASTPDGNLLIGAWADDAGGVREVGSAYLFDGVTGDLLLTINNPTPDDDDAFGFSVATTPDGNLLIGAFLDNTGASDAGSAYLFNGTNRGTTDTPLLTINNPDPDDNDSFGFSVATTPNGDLLIGAFFDDAGGVREAGSAYLFNGTNRGTTDTPLLTINNPDPDVKDAFGFSVATTPDGNLLIGAYLDDTDTVTNAGSVYLFDGTNGNLLLTINNPDPDDKDSFGVSVATTPDGNLLIGAYLDDAGGVKEAGSVYLFDGTDRGTTVTSLLTINNPTPEVDDFFGLSVATTPNGNLLIGAWADSTSARNTGAVYIFAKFIIDQCGFDTSNAENINFGQIFTLSTADIIGEKDVVFPAVAGNSASARVLVEVGDWYGKGTRASGFVELNASTAGTFVTIGNNTWTATDNLTPGQYEFNIIGWAWDDAANLAQAIRDTDSSLIVSTGGTHFVEIQSVARGSVGNLIEIATSFGIQQSGSTLTGGSDTPQLIMNGETTRFTWSTTNAQTDTYLEKTIASVGSPLEVLGGTANSDELHVALMIDPNSATFRNLPYDGPLTQQITITIPSACDGAP